MSCHCTSCWRRVLSHCCGLLLNIANDALPSPLGHFRGLTNCLQLGVPLGLGAPRRLVPDQGKQLLAHACHVVGAVSMARSEDLVPAGELPGTRLGLSHSRLHPPLGSLFRHVRLRPLKNIEVKASQFRPRGDDLGALPRLWRHYCARCDPLSLGGVHADG